MSSRGLAARSKVVASSIMDDSEIAARLGLPVNSQLLMIERVRLAADEPFALETCYLSAIEFHGLAGKALERRSLFTTLERDYGVELAYADEEIDAIPADGKTAEFLCVPRCSALMRIRQLIYFTKAKAVIYVVGLYRSGRHTLVICRFR